MTTMRRTLATLTAAGVVALFLAGCGNDPTKSTGVPHSIDESVKQQLEALRTGNDWVRRDAAQTLGYLAAKDPTIKPVLEEALKKEKQPAVKAAIQAAIKRASSGK